MCQRPVAAKLQTLQGFLVLCPFPSSPLLPPIIEAIKPSNSFFPEGYIFNKHTLQTPEQYCSCHGTSFVELKGFSYLPELQQMNSQQLMHHPLENNLITNLPAQPRAITTVELCSLPNLSLQLSDTRKESPESFKFGISSPLSWH